MIQKQSQILLFHVRLFFATTVLILNVGSIAPKGKTVALVKLGTTIDGESITNPKLQSKMSGHTRELSLNSKYAAQFFSSITFFKEDEEKENKKENIICVWNLTEKEKNITLIPLDDEDYTTAMAFHPTEDLFAIGTVKGSLSVWDLKENQALISPKSDAKKRGNISIWKKPITALAFNPHECYKQNELVVGDENRCDYIETIDLADFKE